MTSVIRLALTLLVCSFLAQKVAIAKTDGLADWFRGSSGNIFKMQADYEAGTLPSEEANHVAGILIATSSRDYSLADERLKVAKEAAKASKDPGFSSLLTSLELIHLIGQEAYADLILFQQNSGVRQNDAGAEILRFRAEHIGALKVPQMFFTLPNVSRTKSRIIIESSVNETPVRLLFDTGGDGVLLMPAIATSSGVAMTDLGFTLSGSEDSRLAVRYGTVDRMNVGEAVFSNNVVTVLNTPWRELNTLEEGESVDGVFGFIDLLRLGGVLDIHVAEGQVTSVTRSPSAETDLVRNVSVIQHKPLVELSIGEDIYSCLFDTGAPITTVSEAIFDRYRDRLSLSQLKRRQIRRRGLFKVKRSSGGYFADLPVKIGGTQFLIESVKFQRQRPDDWCVVGLDAVTQAGGATFDIDNLTLRFHPLN